MRVIVTYQGFNAELEEELYFATRRRPTQVGEKIVTPEVAVHEPDVDGGIHHPKEVQQQHRFLSYTVESPALAEILAAKLREVPGVASVQLVKDPEKPADAE